MSERGSFVTEWLYCRECYHGLRLVLEPFFGAVHMAIISQPILAGKAFGSWSGEEVFLFEFELKDDIQAAICHPVRIAVICDQSDKQAIFRYMPGGEVDDVFTEQQDVEWDEIKRGPPGVVFFQGEPPRGGAEGAGGEHA